MTAKRVRYEAEVNRVEDGYSYRVFRLELPQGFRAPLTGLAGVADTREGALLDAAAKCREYHRDRVWNEARETVVLFEADALKPEATFFPVER